MVVVVLSRWVCLRHVPWPSAYWTVDKLYIMEDQITTGLRTYVIVSVD